MRAIITYIVTFFFFMMESITNYNLGKINNKDTDYNLEYFKKLFKIPPYKELIKIIISVGVFSLLSSFTVKVLDNLF